MLVMLLVPIKSLMVDSTFVMGFDLLVLRMIRTKQLHFTLFCLVTLLDLVIVGMMSSLLIDT